MNVGANRARVGKPGMVRRIGRSVWNARRSGRFGRRQSRRGGVLKGRDMQVPERQRKVNDEREKREPTPNTSIGSEPAHSGSSVAVTAPTSLAHALNGANGLSGQKTRKINEARVAGRSFMRLSAPLLRAGWWSAAGAQPPRSSARRTHSPARIRSRAGRARPRRNRFPRLPPPPPCRDRAQER
jgi:hypothetical protein